MNLLIILKDVDKISIKPSLLVNKSINKIWLLCLSPRGKANYFKQSLQSAINENIEIQVISSRELVRFDDLQKYFLDYIANLPKHLKVEGVPLSDYMVLYGMNLWWASKTVEATAYKSKAFPNFYYLSAIRAALEKFHVNEVWFQVKGSSLEGDLENFLSLSKVKFRNFNKKSILRNFLFQIINDGLPRSIVSFFLHIVASFIFRMIWPAWAKPSLGKPGEKNIHLFFCLYPETIRIESKKIEAKIYGEIPSALENTLGGKAYYICNFSAGSLFRLRSLTTNLSKFWKHRFPAFPTQLFLSPQEIFKTYFSYEGKKKYRALKEKKEYLLSFNLMGISLYNTFDEEIKGSFVGKEAHENLLLFFSLRKFIEQFGERTFQIIYFVEFHALEVALLNGVRAAGKLAPTIGLQQSAPNPILLSFFFPSLIFQERCFTYPLPDLMVTAGEYYKEQLLTFGIPPDKIQVTGLVEGQYINQPKFNLKIKNTRMKELGLTANRKICFIACSIDPVITDGILFLISRVIPRFQEINFLIKGHPTVSISNLIDKYNIGNCDNAETTLQPISDILPLSDYFLSSSSSTSLEALEYGVTQANLDVGGLPNANPLHLLPGLIKDIETEEDLVKFLQNPEMFKIEKEQAKKFFGNIGIDPIKVFTDAVTSNFH